LPRRHLRRDGEGASALLAAAHTLGVAGRVQRQRALGQAGDAEVVGPAAERQYQPPPADRPAPVSSRRPVRPETIDPGLDEAASVPSMERDAYRAGGEVVPVGLVGELGRLEFVKAVKLP
jgi:hypothetical protein